MLSFNEIYILLKLMGRLPFAVLMDSKLHSSCFGPKKPKQFFVLFILAIALSQIKVFGQINEGLIGEIRSKETNETIANAHVIVTVNKDPKIFTSNVDGIFTIPAKWLKSDWSISISFLGYRSLYIKKWTGAKETFFLEKKPINLAEVSVSSSPKSTRYRPLLKYLLSVNEHSLSWEYMLAVYIPQKSKNDKIRLLKYRTANIKGVKGLEYLPFKANVYTVDSDTGLPRLPMMEDTIISKKEEKWITLDVSGHNIHVPPEGLFVVMKILEEEEYDVPFIRAYDGVISAVPAIKYHKFDPEYIRKSYIYIDHGNNFKEGFPIEKWELFTLGHFFMDIELVEEF